jgi:hypothetical protein
MTIIVAITGLVTAVAGLVTALKTRSQHHKRISEVETKTRTL